jgi:DNA-binding MarR family transcriptional regulator
MEGPAAGGAADPAVSHLAVNPALSRLTVESVAGRPVADGVAGRPVAGGVAGRPVADGAAEGPLSGDTTESSAGNGKADDPAVEAWRGLLVAHSRLVPAVEADLRAAGQVPLSWYDVLLELNAAPDRRLRMSELGQRAVLSRTRVSRVVDELAAAGLAERQPDQADGRSSFAALTAPGRDALRRAWPVYRQAIHRQLAARLTAEQCRELAALLSQAVAGPEQVTISR